MNRRNVSFKGKIPLGKVDWLAKMLYNMCGDDIDFMEVSDEDGGVVISLTDKHIEAIANEAVNYVEMEDGVIKMINEKK